VGLPRNMAALGRRMFSVQCSSSHLQCYVCYGAAVTFTFAIALLIMIRLSSQFIVQSLFVHATAAYCL